MPGARTSIMFHEPSKPDLGQPTWTMNQRRRLIGGFLTFITCKDFENRFKDKSAVRAEFWRALTHRTFAYGDTADAKVTDIYARKEFFRLKAQYTTMNDAKYYDASAMGDLTAETLDDFEEIAKEGWAGEYGIAAAGKDAVALPIQQEQQEQQNEGKEIIDPDVDEEEKSTIRGSPQDSSALTAAGAANGKAGVIAGGCGSPPFKFLTTTDEKTQNSPTGKANETTTDADDRPDSPALPRRSIIFKGVSNALNDTLLTESGQGNWIAMLENPAMNQKWALCEVYNMMVEAEARGGSTRNRMRWMKDKVEEWAENGGDMEGDVDGCFVGSLCM